jgi:hypothetical protein
MRCGQRGWRGSGKWKTEGKNVFSMVGGDWYGEQVAMVME